MKIKLHIYKEEGDSVGKKISTEEEIYSVEEFSYNMENKVFGLEGYDFWLGMDIYDANKLISGIESLGFIKPITAEAIANLNLEIDAELDKLSNIKEKIELIIKEI